MTVSTNPFTTDNYMRAVDELKAVIAKQADEIERLREALHNIYRKTSDDHIMQMVDDALQQKDSE